MVTRSVDDPGLGILTTLHMRESMDSLEISDGAVKDSFPRCIAFPLRRSARLTASYLPQVGAIRANRGALPGDGGWLVIIFQTS